MKTYLLIIETNKVKTWKKFGQHYKKKGLGKNLNEAIIKLITDEVD